MCSARDQINRLGIIWNAVGPVATCWLCWGTTSWLSYRGDLLGGREEGREGGGTEGGHRG